jgi:hypothetical protein
MFSFRFSDKGRAHWVWQHSGAAGFCVHSDLIQVTKVSTVFLPATILPHLETEKHQPSGAKRFSGARQRLNGFYGKTNQAAF